MSDHDLEKLLGGFSADTLTAEERQQLYAAALHDQRLFNALADEQALKELLTDPAVRRRLLQTLDQQGTPQSRSWLDRFTSPAGLTWAGGVAIGIFAVVLGVKVYEDSLRQAAETAAVEEGSASTPATVRPEQAPSSEREIPEPRNAAPMPEAPTRDDVVSQPRNSSGNAVDRVTKRRSETEKKGAASTSAPGNSADVPAASREREALPASPSAALTVQGMKETAGAAAASARALFYAQRPAGTESRATGQRKDAQPSKAPERFAFTRNTLDPTAGAQTLALRYAFVIRTAEGSANEVTAADAANQTGPVLLRIETNQEAYLQIWTSTGDSLPELLLPSKETGRISLKTAGGQRQEIVVPPERDRLTLRVARFAFGPITRQEAVMAGHSAGGQITEHASGTEEQATYVANPDASAPELAIDIPVGARAIP